MVAPAALASRHKRKCWLLRVTEEDDGLSPSSSGQSPDMPWWRRAALFGTPPLGADASPADRLRFVRTLSARFLVATLPFYVLIFVLGVPGWLVAVLVASLASGVLNLWSLTRKIEKADPAARERG